MASSPSYQLTTVQKTFFVLLRLSIGWHFLYEGFIKLSHPSWSSRGYLLGSWGPFSGITNWIATAPPFVKMFGIESADPSSFFGSLTPLMVNDVMIPWMLFLAGVGLMLGLFTRTASVIALVLLSIFYFSSPPWDLQMVTAPLAGDQWEAYRSWVGQAGWAGQKFIGAEGNYKWINKNLIEFLAVAALMTVNTGKIFGFDGLVSQYFGKNGGAEPRPAAAVAEPKLQTAE